MCAETDESKSPHLRALCFFNFIISGTWGRNGRRPSKSVKIYEMGIKIVKDSITREDLKKLAITGFGNLVKAVVDIEKGVMAVGGELHADEEALLIEKEGSNREYTWGINLYPDKEGDEFIEFDSVVNIKPSFGNRSRSVEDKETQNKIREIVRKMVQ